MSANPATDTGPQPSRAEDESSAAAMLDLLLARAASELDDIPEPTEADLAAMDELDDLEDIDIPLDGPDLAGGSLAFLADLEPPEVLSLDSLDDEDAADGLDESLEDVDELLDDVEGLIDDFVDGHLDDADLDDEGYDLDEDDDGSYRDLYGEDDTIIPSFREGEFNEDEESLPDYYIDLR